MSHSLFFDWQQKDLQQLFARLPQLPHALLLYGLPGIGKTALARFFAQSLLCEQPAENHTACGTCASCQWFLQESHPDFRIVRPEALDIERAEAEETSAEETTNIEAGGKEKKKASREIRVDQIRALADFVNLGTHRHHPHSSTGFSRKIILLYPAQALNLQAANALLKSLEEPPAHILYLLVADHLDDLLPTILSRCQKHAVVVPDFAQALAWLTAQEGVTNVHHAQALLAEAGGAPLQALAWAQDAERLAAQKLFLEQLSQPLQHDVFRTAQQLQQIPLTVTTDWLQRWMADLLRCQRIGEPRFYPQQKDQVLRLLNLLKTPQVLWDFYRHLQSLVRVAEHPLNNRLQLESLLLRYQEMFVT